MKHILFIFCWIILSSVSVFASPKASGKVTVVDSGCGNWVFTFKVDTGSVVDTLKWSGDDGLIGNTISIRHHFRTSGDSFHYHLKISNHFGNSSVISGIGWIPPYVYVDLPRDTIICDSAMVTIPSYTTGGAPPILYAWSNKNASLTLKAKVWKDTFFSLTVLDKGGAGCMNSDTIHIKVSHKTPSPGNITLHGKDTLYSSCKSRFTNWYLDGNLIAWHQPYVIVTQSGNYEAACVDTACESKRATYTGIVSNEEMTSFFSIFPNPASEQLMLDRNGLNERGRIFVLDLSGKEIFSREIFLAKEMISLSSLASGMYILKYQDIHRIWNAKFVKE